MRKIIYYVATSIDGYISGVNGDISGFVPGGEGINQYFKDLEKFDTVIMGRKTYEFGYDYGLQPGQPAYPHMKHYIFSRTLEFEEQHEKINICPIDLAIIRQLKTENGTPIYLCGGGEFAGWLLENELVDVLKVKLNPLILGDGLRLFGNSKKKFQMELVESQKFEDGLHIITYKIIYDK